MVTNFAIIGGDLRMIKLAKLLAKDKKIVYTYAMEKSQEIQQCENIVECKTLQEISQKSQIIIAPIPFSSDGVMVNTPFSNEQIKIEEMIDILRGKTFIAGAVSAKIKENMQKQNITVNDIMEQEELTILNTIATAEGTIEIAIKNTEINIQESNILVLGFGRVAKMVAKKFKLLDANITCAARKEQDIAWIKTNGYRATNINTIGKNLFEYDIIINTVPHIILTKERIQYLKPECLLIDLASKPGGIDIEEVKQKNIKYIWALALPGKIAPLSTAKFIQNTIYKIVY